MINSTMPFDSATATKEHSIATKFVYNPAFACAYSIESKKL